MRRIYCILTCLLFSTYVFPAESNAQDLPARKQEGTGFQASQFQTPDLKFAPMVRCSLLTISVAWKFSLLPWLFLCRKKGLELSWVLILLPITSIFLP